MVLAGAVLLASAYPTASPDQIRLALAVSGEDINGAVTDLIRLDKADRLMRLRDLPSISDLIPPVNGKGSLETARGAHHLPRGTASNSSASRHLRQRTELTGAGGSSRRQERLAKQHLQRGWMGRSWMARRRLVAKRPSRSRNAPWHRAASGTVASGLITQRAD